MKTTDEHDGMLATVRRMLGTATVLDPVTTDELREAVGLVPLSGSARERRFYRELAALRTKEAVTQVRPGVYARGPQWRRP